VLHILIRTFWSSPDPDVWDWIWILALIIYLIFMVCRKAMNTAGIPVVKLFVQKIQVPDSFLKSDPDPVKNRRPDPQYWK
jgi:hypothetical protein